VQLGSDFFAIAGFAAKAGACAYGATAVEKGVRSGKVLLVIADEGLSPASKKDIGNLCGYYGVPLIWSSPEGKIGLSCGRGHNKLVGITQSGFASRLIEIYNNSENCSEV